MSTGIPSHYVATSDGGFTHPSKVVGKAPPTHATPPTTHPDTLEGIKTPKTPEDRLNKTEREFLGRLRSGVYGVKARIGIQSITLQLGFDTRYTPDFWTRDDNGHMLFYEVKGFMRDDARVKLYAAARAFPFWTFTLVSKSKTINGEWEHKVIDQ